MKLSPAIHLSGCGNCRKEEWLVPSNPWGVIYTSGIVRPQSLDRFYWLHCCSRARAWPIWRERWVCPSLVPGSYKYKPAWRTVRRSCWETNYLMCGPQQIHWS
jgi:hypothetical protein